MVGRCGANFQCRYGCTRCVLPAFTRLRGHLSVELQFRHVVGNAEQLPSRIDLGLATQRETAQAALPDVAEYRLDQTHEVGIANPMPFHLRR